MNQVATTQPIKPATIKQHLEGEQFRNTIAKVLPKHLSPDRMARVAITALTRTPMLAECDQASFFRCLMDLSQWGLEPDGRRAHLIPFRNNQKRIVECQLIIDYKGLVELCYRSGVVSNIHADVVCDNDDFLFDLGEIVRHKIDFKADRGNVYAAYAIVTMKDGTKKCEVLSKQEIDGIRARSKAGRSGPWVTDYNEMAKKTAFRRVSKWIPLSAEIRDAIYADDDVIEGEVVQTTTRRPGIEDLTDFLVGDSSATSSGESTQEEINGEIQPVPHNNKVLADFKALLPTLTTVDAVKDASKAACKECLGTQEQIFETNDLIVEFADSRIAELGG